MKKLTSAQRDELIEQFVELQVDNLDTKTMVAWITDMLTEDYEKLTDSELKETVDCYNEELYDELIDNVTSKPDVALLTMNTDNLPDINDNEVEGITEGWTKFSTQNDN